MVDGIATEMIDFIGSSRAQFLSLVAVLISTELAGNLIWLCIEWKFFNPLAIRFTDLQLFYTRFSCD